MVEEARPRARRRAPLIALVAVLAVLLLLSYCVASAGGPAPAPTDNPGQGGRQQGRHPSERSQQVKRGPPLQGGWPPSAAPTTTPPTAGEDGGYSDYVRRCQQATQDFRNARVVWSQRLTMQLDEASTVRAVVTLETDIPATQILPGPETTEEPVVACHVEARLEQDNAFTVHPSGYRSFALFLAGQERAAWSWSVTPTVHGTRTLILSIQPVVMIEDDDVVRRGPVLGTRSYATTVTVEPDTAARLEGVRAFLRGIEGVLTAAAAVLLALVVVWKALPRLRRKRLAR